jgi:glucose/arabinose dehydrogenase
MRADTLLPAHTAPLDIIFNDGPMMDVLATYTNGAFVTLHGSWDRPTPMGYEVVFLPRDANGRFQMPTIDCNGQLSFSYKVIFGGGTSTTPSEAPWGWSNMGIGETLVRPVGMAINPLDGSLWVTSDNAPVFMRQTAAIGQGALYRIQAAEKKDKK